jgi:cytidylate kinase
MPQVFHVRLVAPWAARVEHLAEQNHISQAEAARIAKSRDQARRAYVRRYFNAEIDEPTLYDLTINTSRFGFAHAADVIVHAALVHHRKFKETGAAVSRNTSPEGVVL